MKVEQITLKGGVKKTALIFRALYAEYSYEWGDPEDSVYYPGDSCYEYKYGIVPVGRRLALVYDPSEGEYEDYTPNDLTEDAAFLAGPKTLRRVLERALEGKSGETNVASADGRALLFVPKGQHLYFRAPCGQHARITKGEARKILEALTELV